MSRQRRPEVQAVIDERIARLQRACDDAGVSRLMRAGGATPGQKPGEWHSAIDLDAFSEKVVSSRIIPRDTEAIVTIKQLIPKLLRVAPSITREQLVGLIVACWPPARGSRAEPLFAARELRAALRALKQDGVTYAQAVEQLAHELRTDRRTIERTIGRARRK